MPMYACNNCGEQCNSELESCVNCGLRQFWLSIPDNMRRWSKCHSCGYVLIWRDQPERCPNPACQQIDPLDARYGMVAPTGKASMFLRREWPFFVPFLIPIVFGGFSPGHGALFDVVVMYVLYWGLRQFQRAMNKNARRLRRLESER